MDQKKIFIKKNYVGIKERKEIKTYKSYCEKFYNSMTRILGCKTIRQISICLRNYG